ncbi:MAG: DUF6978 family protein [Campylobacteraceae bacterium]
MTNEMALKLFEIEKYTIETQYILPKHLENLTIVAKSFDDENNFAIHINRKSLEIQKVGLSLNSTITLRRVDFFGGHNNPTEILLYPDNDRLLELMERYKGFRFSRQSHIHVYIDGYEEKWAFPLSEFGISDNANIQVQARLFFHYCNIINNPQLNYGDITDVVN